MILWYFFLVFVELLSEYNKHIKTVPKNETVCIFTKLLDYAKTSFTLLAASSRVIAE